MSGILTSVTTTINNLIPKQNQDYLIFGLAIFVIVWTIISFIASAATKKRYAHPTQGLGMTAAPTNTTLAQDAKANYDRNLVFMTTVLPLCLFALVISAPIVLYSAFPSLAD